LLIYFINWFRYFEQYFINKFFKLNLKGVQAKTVHSIKNQR